MRTGLLICALLLLSACGFQLQTNAQLPPQADRVHIEIADPYSEFTRRLTTLLEQNGVQIVPAAEAHAVLKVPVNTVIKDIASIGDSARVREFRLTHRVRFSLSTAQGELLVPEQNLRLSRVISFDENDILAVTREEEYLRSELADTLARQVLRRLSTESV